jgi:uncharacterized protein YcbK (DUF882 family)
MDTKLDSLSDAFRPKAMELIARCIEHNVPVKIINTLRTPEEQKRAIANGVSWRTDSLHLIGNAIDIAPIEVLQLKNWAPDHESWMRIGVIGESLGLVWGGRWGQKGGKAKRDCSHFELAG